MATKRSGKTGQAPGAGGELSELPWAGAAGPVITGNLGNMGQAVVLSVCAPKYSGIGDSPDSPWVRVRAEPLLALSLYLSPSSILASSQPVQWRGLPEEHRVGRRGLSALRLVWRNREPCLPVPDAQTHHESPLSLFSHSLLS